MTKPRESAPVGWQLMHDAHIGRARVSVCVGGAAPGDYVGQVVAFDGGHDGTFTLAGFTFRTVVPWGDVLGAWVRHEAPNPCICGRVYDDEPKRAAA